jgi:hypothetical protein
LASIIFIIIIIIIINTFIISIIIINNNNTCAIINGLCIGIGAKASTVVVVSIDAFTQFFIAFVATCLGAPTACASESVAGALWCRGSGHVYAYDRCS